MFATVTSKGGSICRRKVVDALDCIFGFLLDKQTIKIIVHVSMSDVVQSFMFLAMVKHSH